MSYHCTFYNKFFLLNIYWPFSTKQKIWIIRYRDYEIIFFWLNILVCIPYNTPWWGIYTNMPRCDINTYTHQLDVTSHFNVMYDKKFKNFILEHCYNQTVRYTSKNALTAYCCYYAPAKWQRHFRLSYFQH